MTRRDFPLWTLLGVVLVVALLAGSGAFSSSPPTPAQRAAAIESIIRCPSCEDLKVAVSSAPTAVTVRATVAQLVAEGRSDQQIEDYLVARYGSAIVLDPPTSGWSALVWVLPLAVGAWSPWRDSWWSWSGGVGSGRGDLDADVRRCLGGPAGGGRAPAVPHPVAGRRRRRIPGRRPVRRRLPRPPPAGPGPPGRTGPGPDAGGHLHHLHRHPDRGPTRTGQRVGAIGRRPARRRGRNGWFLAGAVVCFAAALAVAVPLFTSDRLPGQTATGSVSLSPSQQLARSLDQAAAVENEGQLGLAAQLYQSVLTAHPDDEVALAQLGWLEYRIGTAGDSASLLTDARAKLNRAAALDPGDYAVHLYLGTVLLDQDGNAAGAADQFRQFLAAGPPATVLSQAASTVRSAFTRAGEPVPSGVPAG